MLMSNSRDFIQYLREFSLYKRTADAYYICSNFNKCYESMLPQIF